MLRILIGNQCKILPENRKIIFKINTKRLEAALNVEAPFLRKEIKGNQVVNHLGWSMFSGRRFRSLKLWFVIRTQGKEGLQANIRKHVNLANALAMLLLNDGRYDIPFEVKLGLVCFRIAFKDDLEKSNLATERLSDALKDDQTLFLATSKLNGMTYLRFVICSRFMTVEHIQEQFQLIAKLTDKIVG